MKKQFLTPFLLLPLILFATKGFTATTDCVDLTGDYRCTLPGDTQPMDVSMEQTVDSDQFPVLSVTYSSTTGGTHTNEFVAKQQLHNGYLALCDKDSFKVLFSLNNGLIGIIDHFWNAEEGKVNIERLVGSLQPASDPEELSLSIIANRGRFSCTKK